MKMALKHLEALKLELECIEVMEEEWQNIVEHVLALESILKEQQTFSSVSSYDLEKAGVHRKLLAFRPEKITELLIGLTKDADAKIQALHTQIKQIYARANMDYEAGSRMILDAIFLALQGVLATENHNIVIFPEMKITEEDGVQISNPDTGYKLQLGGYVNYAVIQYEDIGDHKKRLLGYCTSRQDAIEISKGHLFLVEVERQNMHRDFVSHIPEAVGQAIALLRSANLSEVRFCLSDGEMWIFFVLKSEDGVLTYYESDMQYMLRDDLEDSDLSLRKIMQLVREWLRPTAIDLFCLEK